MAILAERKRVIDVFAPKELMKEAGYTLYECKTKEDVNRFKKYYKDITKRTAKTTFSNYQLASSISGKRLYSEDEMYTYLNELRKTATAGETQLIEVDTASAEAGGNYEAVRYDVLITITEWLGENATISYDIDYSNPVQGTVTISDGKPTFVESL